MARPQKVPLRALGDEEQRTLARIAQARSERLDRVRRARALLALALGQSFAQAARQAGLRSPSAVAGIVVRFNQGGLASLHIAAGRGRKLTYDTAARTRIVSAAQRVNLRPNWLTRTLCDEGEPAPRASPLLRAQAATTRRRNRSSLARP